MCNQFLDLPLHQSPEIALLARMDIALGQTAQSAGIAPAAWIETARTRMKPSLDEELRGFTV